MGFLPGITLALRPCLFCNKDLKSTLIQAAWLWTSKCQGTPEELRTGWAHPPRSERRPSYKLPWTKYFFDCLFKISSKSRETKTLNGLSSFERKWNSSDEALTVSGWMDGREGGVWLEGFFSFKGGGGGGADMLDVFAQVKDLSQNDLLTISKGEKMTPTTRKWLPTWSTLSYY